MEAEKSKEPLENDTIYFFERSDCKERLEKFVEEFPLAKQFLKEIVNEISIDDKLAMLEFCLYVAFIRVLLRVNEDKKSVLEKEELDKYILSNEEIRNRIINEYIVGIMNNAPPVMVDADGGIVSSKGKKPANFFEAGEMAKLILR